MVKLPRFTRNELVVLVAIGVLTPLIDGRVERFLATFFVNISGSVNIFDYTGGPLNSDLLIAWEEYGAVLAAYLVRKPGAATLAMTINGFGQFFGDGFVGPHHLLYGFSGVGADVVFWAFRYRRYDVRASALAGVAAQFFWAPFSYVYHVVYLRPLSFIGGDLLIRVIGGALGDGLLGAGLGVAILQIGSWAGLQIGSPRIPEVPHQRPDAFEHEWIRRSRLGELLGESSHTDPSRPSRRPAPRYLQDLILVCYPDFTEAPQLQVEGAQFAAGDDQDSPQSSLLVDLRLQLHSPDVLREDPLRPGPGFALDEGVLLHAVGLGDPQEVWPVGFPGDKTVGRPERLLDDPIPFS